MEGCKICSEGKKPEDVDRLFYVFLSYVNSLHKVLRKTLINKFYREIHPLFVVSSSIKGLRKELEEQVELENQRWKVSKYIIRAMSH